MEWFMDKWGAFADWTAGQPALLRVLIGSLFLLLAYLLFVTVLSWISSWAREPFFVPLRPGTDTGSKRPSLRSRTLGRCRQRAQSN